ncbi:hypothetical protein PR048_020484 [Dryococelus australis]|uniref:Uncharacterized protein n=1 Tax=Dryococelus australis TaxID=614101 RepID=A0ABQ9H6I7_9NEOP|nr:hypothetical protein PR048_020484 [Dryococelus australis]
MIPIQFSITLGLRGNNERKISRQQKSLGGHYHWKYQQPVSLSGVLAKKVRTLGYYTGLREAHSQCSVDTGKAVDVRNGVEWQCSETRWKKGVSGEQDGSRAPWWAAGTLIHHHLGEASSGSRHYSRRRGSGSPSSQRRVNSNTARVPVCSSPDRQVISAGSLCTTRHHKCNSIASVHFTVVARGWRVSDDGRATVECSWNRRTNVSSHTIYNCSRRVNVELKSTQYGEKLTGRHAAPAANGLADGLTDASLSVVQEGTRRASNPLPRFWRKFTCPITASIRPGAVRDGDNLRVETAPGCNAGDWRAVLSAGGTRSPGTAALNLRRWREGTAANKTPSAATHPYQAGQARQPHPRGSSGALCRAGVSHALSLLWSTSPLTLHCRSTASLQTNKSEQAPLLHTDPRTHHRRKLRLLPLCLFRNIPAVQEPYKKYAEDRGEEGASVILYCCRSVWRKDENWLKGKIEQCLKKCSLDRDGHALWPWVRDIVKLVFHDGGFLERSYARSHGRLHGRFSGGHRQLLETAGCTSLGRYSLTAGVDRSFVRDLGHPDEAFKEYGTGYPQSPPPDSSDNIHIIKQDIILRITTEDEVIPFE